MDTIDNEKKTARDKIFTIKNKYFVLIHLTYCRYISHTVDTFIYLNTLSTGCNTS